MSSQDSTVRIATPEFLSGGGDAGALIRALDWPAHDLGAPELWPQPLKTAVGLLLSTGHPMCLAWGDGLTLLYNDAYAPILADRHPGALGRGIPQIWGEVWWQLASLVDRALAGEAIWLEEMHLVMTRGGRAEDTWWTFSYSPIRNEAGVVRGFLNVCNDVTGKVLTERRLTAERERFHALVTASSDVVYRMSADWTEMRVLDGRGFLADTDQPSIRWIDEYILPEDRSDVTAAIDAAVKSKGTFELEHRVRRADHSVGWAFSRAVPVLSADGEIVEWFGMASDVSERRHAEERLIESEGQLRFAMKAGRFGTWTLDIRNGELTTSDTCRTNFGRSPHAPFSYADLRAAVHPDDQARMAATVEQSIAAHTDYDIDYRIVTPGGETRWVAVRAQPTYAEDGTPLSMAGVSIDITDRKRTDAQLATSESRYRALFEAVDAGFCVIELKFDDAGRAIDYRHVESNPAFAQQTGLEGRLGVWMSDLLPDLERHWFDIYGGVVRTGEAVRFENRAEPLDRWFDVHAFRLGDAEDRRVAVLFNDITERKRTDERLRTLNETLEAQVADRTLELRQFRDIVEATTSPICAFDTDFRLIAFNTAPMTSSGA